MDRSPVAGHTLTFEFFVALVLLYHILAKEFKTPKQHSWILTTLSSFIMTFVSLPFVLDLVTTGSVSGVQVHAHLAYPACRFFQTYLMCDLVVGIAHYPDQLTLSTGWFHHTIYLFIVELAIRRSLPHVFCLASLMELPTFILGLGTLYPHLRSNTLFAGSFFMTRLVFHFFLAVSYYMPPNRSAVTAGSYLPAIILTLVFPMHAIWFSACVKGFIRRAHRDASISISGVAIIAVPNGLDTHWVPHALRTPYQTYRTRISQRQHSLKQIWVHRVLPGRDKVFEYVGLGRRLRNSRLR